MSEYRDEIIKQIRTMSSAHSVYELFDDWVKMCALSISNAVDVLPSHWADREQLFDATRKKYEDKVIEAFGDLFGMLVLEAESGFYDILGYIYMHLEISSSKLGQFFTPYHVCQMMARMRDERIDGICSLYEPSCGAGGNVIAMAEYLHGCGVNYQECMNVTCQDLDWKAVYMCYVQLSLYGIPAKVIQGDTLANRDKKDIERNTFYTPAYVAGISHF